MTSAPIGAPRPNAHDHRLRVVVDLGLPLGFHHGERDFSNLWRARSFLDRRLTARASNLSVLAAIGLPGMRGTGLGDPECADRVVDAVPDPSTRSNLKLPLFHAPITYGDYTEAALKAVLTAVGPAGVASDGCPRPIDGLGDLPQQLVPSVPSTAICGSDRPRVRSCDFVTPFGHAE